MLISTEIVVHTECWMLRVFGTATGHGLFNPDRLAVMRRRLDSPISGASNNYGTILTPKRELP